MNDGYKEIFSSFKEITKIQNNKFLEKKFPIASKEMLSLWVSECLNEDINTIEYLKNNEFQRRYIDSIIRNMCEQTIEYLYIMKHQDLIEVYFGKNLDTEFDISDENKLFENLRKTGEARYNNGRREKVATMSKDIDEEVSSEEKIALYDIFRLKAELEHNSYFHHVFDVIGEIEDTDDEIQSDKYLDKLFMTTIINVFLECYTGIKIG